MNGLDDLDDLAREWAPLGPPIVVFNKSHSGSRMLVRALAAAGVDMGAARSESEDAVALLPAIEHIVERHYPRFDTATIAADRTVAGLLRAGLAAHCAGIAPGARWGWKLCETGHALPLLARVFPQAQWVHLLRDGRDVAFSDHAAPTTPFWRKIYFDSAELWNWRGLPLTQDAYRRHAHVFNAQHWTNSVRAGRGFGVMLGERYHELRYEDLCADFVPTASELCAALGIACAEPALRAMAPTVRRDAVGKHRRKPAWQCAEVADVAGPLLVALGYATSSDLRAATRWWRRHRVLQPAAWFAR